VEEVAAAVRRADHADDADIVPDALGRYRHAGPAGSQIGSATTRRLVAEVTPWAAPASFLLAVGHPVARP
jgi:hypothetical protein